MFGLTQREQRWAAELKAAELITTMTVATINAQKEIILAEVNGEAEKLREENALLHKKVGLLERAINVKGATSAHREQGNG